MHKLAPYSITTKKPTSYWQSDFLDGEAKIYDSTGNLKERVNYVQGVKEGVVEYFNEGLLLRKYEYENNVAHGKYLEFHPNGQVMKLGYFENNQAVGDYFYYDDNGLLLSKRDYAVIDGKSAINQYWGYDSLGNLIIENSNFITIESNSDGVKFELTAPFNGDVAFLSIGKAEYDFGSYEEVYFFEMDDRFNYTVDYSKLIEIDTIRGFVEDRKLNDDGGYQRRKIYFELTKSDFKRPVQS